MSNEKLVKPELEIDASPEEAEVLKSILQAIRQIKYGSVQITIQDAQVVQIERTEKYRFNRK